MHVHEYSIALWREVGEEGRERDRCFSTIHTSPSSLKVFFSLLLPLQREQLQEQLLVDVSDISPSLPLSLYLHASLPLPLPSPPPPPPPPHTHFPSLPLSPSLLSISIPLTLSSPPSLQRYADLHNMVFVEASAKNNQNVQECFLHLAREICKIKAQNQLQVFANTDLTPSIKLKQSRKIERDTGRKGGCSC